MKISIKAAAFCPLNETREQSKYEAFLGEIITPKIMKSKSFDRKIEDELVI